MSQDKIKSNKKIKVMYKPVQAFEYNKFSDTANRLNFRISEPMIEKFVLFFF
jgi:hypothetical protein